MEFLRLLCKTYMIGLQTNYENVFMKVWILSYISIPHLVHRHMGNENELSIY